jgi:hypothetical protein
MLDELASAIRGIRFDAESEQLFYPLETHPARPLEAPTGIEPVYTACRPTPTTDLGSTARLKLR